MSGALDPEVAEALAGSSPSAISFDDLPGLRRAQEASLSSVALSGRVEHADHVVSANPRVLVRVYAPKQESDALRPCVYWIHGGGYVVGSFKGHDATLQRWCELLDCVAVSVEYRLAPEHPYPAALDDCYAGLRWIYHHAADLGIDVDAIGVAGSSAGGGLAAALTLLARDRGDIALSFQALLSPMLDDRMATASSQWDAPVWPPASNATGWRAYLGALYGGTVSPYAAPARADDLLGLPPAFVRVGAVDGFLDENLEYARRLAHAGVPVQLHVYPGAPHGFDSRAADTRIARLARRDLEDWLRIALHGVPALT